MTALDDLSDYVPPLRPTGILVPGARERIAQQQIDAAKIANAQLDHHHGQGLANRQIFKLYGAIWNSPKQPSDAETAEMLSLKWREVTGT